MQNIKKIIIILNFYNTRVWHEQSKVEIYYNDGIVFSCIVNSKKYE